MGTILQFGCKCRVQSAGARVLKRAEIMCRGKDSNPCRSGEQPSVFKACTLTTELPPRPERKSSGVNATGCRQLCRSKDWIPWATQSKNCRMSASQAGSGSVPKNMWKYLFIMVTTICVFAFLGVTYNSEKYFSSHWSTDANGRRAKTTDSEHPTPAADLRLVTDIDSPLDSVHPLTKTVVVDNMVSLEYKVLWKFASDVRQFWMLILSSLEQEKISNRTMDIMQDWYKILQNQIKGSSKTVDSKGKQVSVLVGKSALENISSDLKHFWAASQARMSQGKISDKQLIELNRAYGNVDVEIIKLMDLSTSKRKKIIEKLSSIVQKKIQKLQFPEDCSKARLQTCELDPWCGFGCNVHWVTNCMMDAFEKERTVVFISKGWNYAREGWDYAFQPTGHCTWEGSLNSLPGFRDDKSRVVRWQKRDRTEEVSYTIPTKLAPTLAAVLGRPDVWWIAQFVSHVTRYQKWMNKKIEKISSEIGFKSPVVGVQIRRGDKVIWEAKKIGVEEYMFYVNQWFLEYELTNKVGQRTVYVATDGEDVFAELQKKYPGYKFIMNTQKGRGKYNKETLQTMLTDLHFLSRSDYVVCSFSSNVGRTVYEVMMSLYPDASKRIESVDNAYSFTNGLVPVKVVLDHKSAGAKDEMEFNVGDEIEVVNDPHWSYHKGFLWEETLGKNNRRKFPAYKVEGGVRLKNYTIFNDVKLIGVAKR